MGEGLGWRGPGGSIYMASVSPWFTPVFMSLQNHLPGSLRDHLMQATPYFLQSLLQASALNDLWRELRPPPGGL